MPFQRSRRKLPAVSGWPSKGADPMATARGAGGSALTRMSNCLPLVSACTLPAVPR
jgi:hypothetical protein